ncbi:MAG: CAP family protein [Flavobacteriaceae bacterium]|nr:CAP family protein [Flavobacteriaceae bacterium]
MILIDSFFLIVLFFSTNNEMSANLYPQKNLSNEDRTLAVKVHNQARSEVGVKDIKWSETLSLDALKWAKHLADKNKMFHSNIDKRKGQGENLYSSYGYNSQTPGKDASKAWYDEKKDYKYSKIANDKNFYKTGHYTQMIWEETTEFGMAKATSENGTIYVVARYSPPGNYIGLYPY